MLNQTGLFKEIHSNRISTIYTFQEPMLTNSKVIDITLFMRATLEKLFIN